MVKTALFPQFLLDIELVPGPVWQVVYVMKVCCLLLYYHLPFKMLYVRSTLLTQMIPSVVSHMSNVISNSQLLYMNIWCNQH